MFGKTTQIQAGGHKLGAIGDERLGTAVDHVCGQLQTKFGKRIERMEPLVSRSDGSCTIVILTRGGLGAEECKRIGESANALLDSEVLYQAFITRLLGVVDNHNLADLVGAARSDVRSLGQEIDEASGFAGMAYVSSAVGQLRRIPGIARTLEVAWNGIGGWRS